MDDFEKSMRKLGEDTAKNTEAGTAAMSTMAEAFSEMSARQVTNELTATAGRLADVAKVAIELGDHDQARDLMDLAYEIVGEFKEHRAMIRQARQLAQVASAPTSYLATQMCGKTFELKGRRWVCTERPDHLESCRSGDVISDNEDTAPEISGAV